MEEGNKLIEQDTHTHTHSYEGERTKIVIDRSINRQPRASGSLALSHQPLGMLALQALLSDVLTLLLAPA